MLLTAATPFIILVLVLTASGHEIAPPFPMEINDVSIFTIFFFVERTFREILFNAHGQTFHGIFSYIVYIRNPIICEY